MTTDPQTADHRALLRSKEEEEEEAADSIQDAAARSANRFLCLALEQSRPRYSRISICHSIASSPSTQSVAVSNAAERSLTGNPVNRLGCAPAVIGLAGLKASTAIRQIL